MTAFPIRKHRADVCVVGGGMAGFCAALAAARHGARVVLMHDRPVLGGNASSECRVHICGADRHNNIPNLRETGILEEVRLDNLARNPVRSYSAWDLLLYEKIVCAPKIVLLLNCSCLDAAMKRGAIASVRGWQLTTQTSHEVAARIFIDCSGDGILAPLTGAEFRVGREARREYGETIAPEKADRRTMGMTCLFQAREYPIPQPFVPPPWIHRYERCEDLPYGAGGHKWLEMGYWWIELGGEHDSIHDTEKLRDELLKTTLGVWDHLKNHCRERERAANWALDWLQFLPAKRESRRYVGAHVLTQNDIAAGGRFEDSVAYGGWSMDDHHPAGFRAAARGKPATVFHPAPSPYGIPYRCLYSRNVPNLMFAGRVASCTHAAMSSTRVMGSGCSMGQAAGTAAAWAVRARKLPAQLAPDIPQLQQALLRDDAYLPGIAQIFSPLTMSARLAASAGDPAPLRDGVNRPVGAVSHAWECRPGDRAEYVFDKPRRISAATIIVDSALDRLIAMSRLQRDDHLEGIPQVMTREFVIQALEGDSWIDVERVQNNHQRLRRVAINRAVKGVRCVMGTTWGAQQTRLYAFYLE